MRGRIRSAAFLFVLLLGAARLAAAFSLEVPLDCSGAELCVVQNYYDRDSSNRAVDYTCGPLSYDKHTGTDIRVSYADMERGVPVLAAADGVVRAVRDGEPEGEISLRGKAGIKDREAGNAVVLTHENGYETQYSHLKKGSIAVRPGQQIKAGQLLGLVGLSGGTEFPHLEISVRYRGLAVDPFMGLVAAYGCGTSREPLWSPAALGSPVLAYKAGGLVDAGFLSAPPRDAIGLLRHAGWIAGSAGDPQALVFGAAAFGLRRGDVWTLRLLGPDRAVLAESRTLQEADQAQVMRYVGCKRKGAWPPGRYTGELRIERPSSGRDVAAAVREIQVP